MAMCVYSYDLDCVAYINLNWVVLKLEFKGVAFDKAKRHKLWLFIFACLCLVYVISQSNRHYWNIYEYTDCFAY